MISTRFIFLLLVLTIVLDAAIPSREKRAAPAAPGIPGADVNGVVKGITDGGLSTQLINGLVDQLVRVPVNGVVYFFTSLFAKPIAGDGAGDFMQSLVAKPITDFLEGVIGGSMKALFSFTSALGSMGGGGVFGTLNGMIPH